MYGILADTVVFIHLLWILFLVMGAYWGRKYVPAMVLHIGGLAFAGAMQVFGWFCPLTHLEVWLRERGPGGAYPGSFIAHYAEKLVYVDVTGTIISVLTVILIVANGLAYWSAFRKKKAK